MVFIFWNLYIIWILNVTKDLKIWGLKGEKPYEKDIFDQKFGDIEESKSRRRGNWGPMLQVWR